MSIILIFIGTLEIFSFSSPGDCSPGEVKSAKILGVKKQNMIYNTYYHGVNYMLSKTEPKDLFLVLCCYLKFTVIHIVFRVPIIHLLKAY